ncbi:MAG: DUF456 domain-containing protein [Balneolaceae bacterium]|nr:MAG: DUF456 domain-containing protein [Balneolaceae bacterium]
MEILIIVIASLFLIAGLIGAFIPVVPGTPLSYIGILVFHFGMGGVFSWLFLISWGIVVVITTTMDAYLPAEGARRSGGSKLGIYGALLGALLGLFFFPPAGIVIGPVIGAFAGELVAGKQSGSALKAAMGSFVGYLVATGLKVGVAIILAYQFLTHL